MSSATHFLNLEMAPDPQLLHRFQRCQRRLQQMRHRATAGVATSSSTVGEACRSLEEEPPTPTAKETISAEEDSGLLKKEPLRSSADDAITTTDTDRFLKQEPPRSIAKDTSTTADTGRSLEKEPRSTCGSTSTAEADRSLKEEPPRSITRDSTMTAGEADIFLKKEQRRSSAATSTSTTGEPGRTLEELPMTTAGSTEDGRSPEAETPRTSIVAPENLHITVGVLGLDHSEEEAHVIRLLQDPETKRQVERLHEGRTIRAHLSSLEVFQPVNGLPDSNGPCAVVVLVNEAQSRRLMSVVHHLRQLFAPFLRERLRDAGLPYRPHVTLAMNCYYGDDPAELLEVGEEGVAEFGECAVSKVYLSKLNDTTEEGVHIHHATLLLADEPSPSQPS